MLVNKSSKYFKYLPSRLYDPFIWRSIEVCWRLHLSSIVDFQISTFTYIIFLVYQLQCSFKRSLASFWCLSFERWEIWSWWARKLFKKTNKSNWRTPCWSKSSNKMFRWASFTEYYYRLKNQHFLFNFCGFFTFWFIIFCLMID